MTIIGIDTHIATCDYFALSADRKILGQGTFKTSALSFRQTVSEIKGKPKVVVIEQGPLADWIRRILRPMVSKIVVAEPRRNRWIAKDGVKNDRFDSEKLVTLYRGGFIKEVVPRDERNEQLLRLAMQHYDLVKSRVQVKNKIKAKFRQNGIRASGISVFNQNNRQSYLAQLSTSPYLISSVEMSYVQLDLLDNQIKEITKQLGKLARQYPIISLLIKKFPGVGLINACRFVALIDTPDRFSTVKKLWTYFGLGLDIRSSGLKAGYPRLTRRGNRLLKHTLKSATHVAVKQSFENSYRQYYLERIKQGKPEHKILLTCSRKLAKDMWLTWKEKTKGTESSSSS